MQIIRKEDARLVVKPEGAKVWDYLFDGYDIHYMEVPAGTPADWHWHDTIEEVIMVVSGRLLAEWIENGKPHREVLHPGDLLRSERSVHAFTCAGDDLTRFVVFKLVVDTDNHREVFKTDKHVVQVATAPTS